MITAMTFATKTPRHQDTKNLPATGGPRRKEEILMFSHEDTRRNTKVKITKDRLQNTNKFQITMSEPTNGRIAFKTPFRDCRRRRLTLARRAQSFLEFGILELWFVCNLYFVICNFPSCIHAFNLGAFVPWWQKFSSVSGRGAH